MPVSTDETLVKSAYECVKENATQMESKENKEKPDTIQYRYAPRFVVTQVNYMKFLKTHGVTADVVDKLTQLEQAWNQGAAQFATEQIQKLAPTALADKEFNKVAGPKAIRASVFTSLKDGKRAVIVNAYSENRNPRATSEKDAIVCNYGRMDISHKITHDFDPDFVTWVSDTMEKEFKGKF